ncbi:MAG: FG-GAP repeat protein, partial [Nostoc sp. TH1S01]|nr:FG-GAP repeat protein [Nostoc sp. TH1S01]
MANLALNLSDLNGSNGFVINGIDNLDFSGFSVSNAGDINGDGIDDLIIGAYRADPNGQNYAGESYVVFGSRNGFGASFNLSSLDGSNGFVINGIDEFDFSGRSVSGAGDINGDGIDDLIIGASGADSNGQSDAGESYVVFGSRNGFEASFNLSSLDCSNGFGIKGID